MSWRLFKWLGKQTKEPTKPPDSAVERCRLARRLAENFSFQHIEDEPLPPWLEYPEILVGSMGWRMGMGENYLHETFYPYWRDLGVAEQDNYLEKFDLGPNWPDRDLWFASLEANKLPA